MGAADARVVGAGVRARVSVRGRNGTASEPPSAAGTAAAVSGQLGGCEVNALVFQLFIDTETGQYNGRVVAGMYEPESSAGLATLALACAQARGADTHALSPGEQLAKARRLLERAAAMLADPEAT